MACCVLAACAVEEPRDPSFGESEGDEVSCVPGEQRACACPGGAPDGVQICEAGGKSLGPCMGCPGGSDGGSAETGAETGAGGTTGADGTTGAVSGSATTTTDGGGSSDEWGLPPEGPPDAFHVVEQLAMERPDLLMASCVKTGGNNEFLFEAVRRLRMIDQRWGMNWKRGMIGDLSQDVVDYHFGEGEPEESTDVFIIDIIVGHCGDDPQAGWIDVTLDTLEGGTIGMWTLAGQDL